MSGASRCGTRSAAGSARGLLRRAGGWVCEHIALIAAVGVLGYLFLPVVYILVFSFNDYRKSNLVWHADGSPTLKHWADPCGAPGICSSLVTSLQVGLLSTVGATALGTAMAYAMVRHRFRARRAMNVLVFLPMATPEVVLGASLLTIIVQGLSSTGLRLGFWAIVAAHVMFCLSFVVVTVKARLTGLDWYVEEAAMDLYAGPWTTFSRVTLPLAAPGILAAALLSFALSFDDFIVTNFVSGDAVTFPKYVYVSYLRGVPAQANVIGIGMFIAALLVTVVVSASRSRRAPGHRKAAVADGHSSNSRG